VKHYQSTFERKPLRVAILQQRVTSYRAGVFAQLALKPDLDVTVHAASFDGPTNGVACRVLKEIRLGPLRVHPEVLSDQFRESFDVVVVEGRLSLVTSLALVESRHPLPVVWWTSLWRKDGTIGPQYGALGRITRRALRRATSIVTYSHTARLEAIRTGVSPDRVYVAPNSLDTPRLEEAESLWRSDPQGLADFLRDRGIDSPRVALFLGRLIPDKKLGLLVEAWAHVVRRHSGDSPLLVVVGDGPERESLLEASRRLGIEGRLRLVGDVRDIRKVCPFILGARALVLPGAGGLAVNQAMTHGLPAIVGGGDGTELDVIDDGLNGYIVRSGDPDELARRIEEVIFCSSDRWAALSRAAKEAIDRRQNLALMIQGLAGAIRAAASRAGPAVGNDESTRLQYSAGGA
jgi:glycosyltransferase involved in cell wall biosynthesis